MLNDDIASDRLQGISAIAKFIDESERRTHYLLSKGLIPCGKRGGRWEASKRAILADYERVTGGKAS
jgi:hypothetical protein